MRSSFSLDLQKKLSRASKFALADVRAMTRDEALYGVSLITNPLGTAVSLIAQTEENLDRKVCQMLEQGEWSSQAGDAQSLLKTTQRWTGEGWLAFEPIFEDVNRFLGALYGADPDAFFDSGVTRLVFLCCLTVLGALDAQGRFGRGRQRDSVVLNLFISDQSEEELIAWARSINPQEASDRYARELRGAGRAFKRLAYARKESARRG